MMWRRGRRKGAQKGALGRVVMGLLAAAVVAMYASPTAVAGTPELLSQVPEDGSPGAEVGRLDFPWGIAAAQNLPGHVYVADRFNLRIDEFTPWGEFVRAWGSGVKDGGNEAETCDSDTGCLKGLVGAGSGQFNSPEGLAVDTAGEVYVAESGNHRVQKFDPEGNFISMFGFKVNKTKVEAAAPEPQQNVCPVDPGDVCQAGAVGTGPGQFGGDLGGYLNRVTTSSIDGTVYIGEGKRIQAFNPDGTFEEEIELPSEVRALASDPSGNLYVAFFGEGKVRKLSPTGPVANFLEPSFLVDPPNPLALALEPGGHLFVADGTVGSEVARAFEFDASGKCLDCGEEGEGREPGFDRSGDGTSLWSMATTEACGPLDVFIAHFGPIPPTSYFNIYGPHPDTTLCPPPKAAPSILGQFATSVRPDNAALKAQINPHFWDDASYYLEYGTGKCSEGGCEIKQPLPPGTSLGGKVVNLALSASVFLANLSPATTYHYRFVAQSSGSEGQPVRGVGGKVGEDGAEGAFTTPSTPTPPPNPDTCPNAQFRSSLSAFLPDCRAYEMVSPVDKNNGDILTLQNINAFHAALNQSATSGQKLTYSTYRAFGDAQSGPYTSQYIASRESGGWASHSISPPRNISFVSTDLSLETEFWAFSPDLCMGWLRHDTDPPLAAGAPEGFASLYRRENCGEEGYEAIVTETPPNLSSQFFAPELEGVSGDGEHAVFRVNDQLTGNANPIKGGLPHPNQEGTNYQCYGSFGGELSLLSVLPNGATNKTNCSVGTAGQGFNGRSHAVSQAISEDGSRVFWTASAAVSGPGQVYLRVNSEQSQSAIGGGKCTEPELACTIAVSQVASPEPARFWTAAADGSKAVFTIGDLGAGKADLYEAELEEKEEAPLSAKTTLIAHGVAGLLGAGEDASHIYFVSREALDEGAAEGKPNLYLYEAGEEEGEEGTTAFIATLAAADAPATNTLPSPVSPEPVQHLAQVTPDGLHAVFMSAGSLTGFDNIDANSGEADMEVYLYDASASGGAGKLLCVSCNPTEVRPSGAQLPDGINAFPGLWAAAQIPPSETQLHAPHVLSEDGARLFFDSFEALVPRDTNGKEDVYEWEAPGEGKCSEEDPAFSHPNGGCISLISSGENPSDSEFVDADADGSDVFFSTSASLLVQDPGLIDLYDARIAGGFPAPIPPKPPCEGEACQSPPGPPNDPTPATAVGEGPGNVHQVRPRCRKGKVRRHGRCVAKKAGRHHKRRAHRSREARR